MKSTKQQSSKAAKQQSGKTEQQSGKPAREDKSGRAPPPLPTVHAGDNAQTKLTCAPDGTELVATQDPSDRAHRIRDEQGLLIPATDPRARGVSKPRLYPRQHMLVVRSPSGEHRVVAADSAWDWLYEAQAALEGIPGLGLGHAQRSIERALAVVESRSDVRLRDVLEPRTRQRDVVTGKVS